MTFKDFGARFLAQYLKAWINKKDKNDKKQYTVLVSTSGDTGSAIASAFHKADNIKVMVLYPNKRISHL
mgnify:CR=1 FL=1